MLLLLAIGSLDGAGWAKPRNVLLIAIDDLNDWVSCLEPEMGVPTPNIDALAARGTLFTNAHAVSPLCGPSRAALLLGLQPSRTGLYGNQHWWRPHLPDAITLPAAFKRAGYRVVGAGKIHHHMPGFNPPDQWHHFEPQVIDDPWRLVGSPPPTGPGAPLYPPGFPKNGLEAVARGQHPPSHPSSFDWGPLALRDDESGDGHAVTWAERFLEDAPAEPFFLAVGIYRPHAPYYAPARYFNAERSAPARRPKLIAGDLDDLPAAGRRMAAVRGEDYHYLREVGRYDEAVTAYRACIRYADALVGRVVAALDRSGRAADTVVVLLSDHGYHLGEKEHWHKNTLWERATHVPLIIVAPGVARPGSRSRRAVSLIDLYPTLTDLAGVETPAGLDGLTLTPVLRDPEAQWPRPALITYGRGNHAVRDERWRYIRYADGGEELYDHAADPEEWRNLAGIPEHAARKAALAGFLPATDALPAPAKEAYVFDAQTYRWRFATRDAPDANDGESSHGARQ